MASETGYEYKYCFVANDFSADGRVKPYVYQNIIQNVAERHLLTLGLETERLAEKNLAFVLVGMTVEILGSPRVSDIITGKTWHSETKGPYFRRDFAFCFGDGGRVFSGACFSVMLDLSKRTIVHRFALPDGIGSSTGEFAIENAVPGIKDISGYTSCGKRRVYRSCLDALGHVNNTRYCEFAYDALDAAEASRFIRRIRISFSGELTGNDSVEIFKAQAPGMTYFRGIRSSDAKKSFAAVFEYGNPV